MKSSGSFGSSIYGNRMSGSSWNQLPINFHWSNFSFSTSLLGLTSMDWRAIILQTKRKTLWKHLVHIRKTFVKQWNVPNGTVPKCFQCSGIKHGERRTASVGIMAWLRRKSSWFWVNRWHQCDVWQTTWRLSGDVCTVCTYLQDGVHHRFWQSDCGQCGQQRFWREPAALAALAADTEKVLPVPCTVHLYWQSGYHCFALLGRSASTCAGDHSSRIQNIKGDTVTPKVKLATLFVASSSFNVKSWKKRCGRTYFAWHSVTGSVAFVFHTGLWFC